MRNSPCLSLTEETAQGSRTSVRASVLGTRWLSREAGAPPRPWTPPGKDGGPSGLGWQGAGTQQLLA